MKMTFESSVPATKEVFLLTILMNGKREEGRGQPCLGSGCP